MIYGVPDLVLTVPRFWWMRQVLAPAGVGVRWCAGRIVSSPLVLSDGFDYWKQSAATLSIQSTVP